MPTYYDLRNRRGALDPARTAAIVTPDDDNDLPGGVCASLVVDGAVNVTTDRDDTLILPDLGVFEWALYVRRVHATDTTAANIVALY
jgi:hypothetical protein